MIGEIAQQMLVEEFRAVVAIEAFQRERQQVLDGLNLFQDALRAFVPGGPAFGPAGDDVGHGQTPDEIAGQRIAAVGHGIGFDEARLSFVPVMSANRNLGFQQRTGLGAGQTLGMLDAQGLEQAIQSRGRHGQQVCANIVR